MSTFRVLLFLVASVVAARAGAADPPPPLQDGFIAQEARAWARATAEVDWTGALLLGTGLTLASSALDRRTWDAADRRRDSAGWASAVRAGNALPFAALGVSGILAAASSQPRLVQASLASFEAGAAAVVLTEGLKAATGRARPNTGLGLGEFDPFSHGDARASFPSRHTAVMWAAVTPYALEYDLPWLHALATVTNVARVASREHWLSDTVGGAFVGYGLGQLALRAQTVRAGSEGRLDSPRLVIGPGAVVLVWILP